MGRFTYIVALIFITSLALRPANAQLDPRVKVVLSVSAYGTIGGALLGLASLPFGTGGRAVAIGASVGLYIGLAFGGFVVVSHHAKKKGWGETKVDGLYPESKGPYEGGGGFLPPGSVNQGEEESAGGEEEEYYEDEERWAIRIEMQELSEIHSWSGDPFLRRHVNQTPQVYIPLLHLDF